MTDDNQSQSTICDCGIRSPLLRFLNEEELHKVEQTKLTIFYKKGETIRKQGTAMTHVLSVHSGMAKLYLEGIEHRNAIVRIVKSCSFIGGPGIYLDQKHHYTLTALTDTTICFIDMELFKELIEQNTVFFHEFMMDFSRNIISINNRLLSLTQKQMAGRMADTLLYLSKDIFQSRVFSVHLSRQDLSELSGMSKESAVKILRDFTNEGIIENVGRDLKLINPDALARISKLG